MTVENAQVIMCGVRQAPAGHQKGWDMNEKVEHYLSAAERENTRRSYRSALRHFEQEWGGLLPANSEMIARYLADHAGALSVATLQQRLAALASWHAENGFMDPTRSPRVRQVMKGIRSVHGAPARQARPLALEVLEALDRLLQAETQSALRRGQGASALRAARDRALFLIGFWRGFRSDELSRLCIEHIVATEGKGMQIFLPTSKADRGNVGRHFNCPALSRCCPVDAYLSWLELSGLNAGPAFRKIDRHGHVLEGALHPGSLAPLLRGRLDKAGLINNRKEAGAFSSHSLRRGFATWARDCGWDVKALMAYVGWKDVRSALRYIEDNPSDLQARFEAGLRSSEGL